MTRLTLIAVAMLGTLCCHGHGSVHQRIEEYSARIAETPGRALLHVERGRLWLLHEDYEEAAADFERALELDPESAEARILNAGARLRVGQFEGAAAEALRYQKEHGEHFEASIILARAAAGLNEVDASVAHYEKAFSMITHVSPDLFIEQARVAATAGAGGLKRAIDVLDRAMVRLGRIVSLEHTREEFRKQLAGEGARP